MILTPTVVLDTSSPNNYTDLVSIIPTDVNRVINFNIMVRRPESITDYADGIIAGINPILSYEEFSNRFKSIDEDISLVTDFADTVGFTIIETHPQSATIKLSGTVAQINTAFGITLTDYTNTVTTFTSHSGPLNIPAVLDDVIEFIVGLDLSIGISKPKGQIKVINSETLDFKLAFGNTAYVNPADLASTYSYPGSDAKGQTIGIMEWGGGYNQTNLNSTFNLMAQLNPKNPVPPKIGTDIIDVSTDGGFNNINDSYGTAEVMLDILCVWGTAPKSKIVMYFGYGAGASSPTAGSNWYNNYNTAIHDTVNCPSVISTSWGAGENYATDGYWSAGTVAATEAVLAQAVAVGITILCSSGDGGSTWAGVATEVLYPASSAYVIGVGGTSLDYTDNLGRHGTRKIENAWSGSGGGLSIYQSRPSYQNGLTYTTISTGGTVGSPSALTARGVPDVAANADPQSGYVFYYGSSNIEAEYGGTSAATPIIAGLIARLNALTGTRLGFANPFLYANPTAFFDVTTGSNAVSVLGYTTTVGWDAVTGLGVPVGTALYKALHTGNTFPKKNYGFRQNNGPTYPRKTTGAR